ncbi:DUF3817 domain-containing protein [Malikia spinosa]|nr:DUF3817 domain-containing protein [Malikia spinosa]
MNSRLRPLRLGSWLEGMTLLLLLLVAVPLKRLAAWPDGVALMGPLHGAAFLLYLGLLAHACWMRQLRGRDGLLLLGAAFVPFGAFVVGRIFARDPL